MKKGSGQRAIRVPGRQLIYLWVPPERRLYLIEHLEILYNAIPGPFWIILFPN